MFLITLGHSHQLPPRAVLALSVLTGLLLTACPGGLYEEVDSGVNTDAGSPDTDCVYFCGVEESCGWRSYADCLADSCRGGSWTTTGSDGCVDEATDCAAIALCPCQARCEADAACFGSADPDCTADCQTLAEQTPAQTYLESRCVIETECEDIALCTDT